MCTSKGNIVRSSYDFVVEIVLFIGFDVVWQSGEPGDPRPQPPLTAAQSYLQGCSGSVAIDKKREQIQYVVQRKQQASVYFFWCRQKATSELISAALMLYVLYEVRSILLRVLRLFDC